MNTRGTYSANGPEFEFWRLHIPTGQRTTDWHRLPQQYSNVHLDALVLVDQWNAQQAGVWQYGLTP